MSMHKVFVSAAKLQAIGMLMKKIAKLAQPIKSMMLNPKLASAQLDYPMLMLVESALTAQLLDSGMKEI
jgi:hypothetical protein